MVTTRAQARRIRAQISAQKVFDLPEMLEHILLDNAVDMKTLLLAQRVSKTFQATIQGSTKLLRKLWLLPDISKQVIEFNPFLTNLPSAKSRSLSYLLNSLNVSHGDVSLRLNIGWFSANRAGSWQKLQFIRSHHEQVEVHCGIDARVTDRYSGRMTFLHDSWVMEIGNDVTFEAFLKMAQAKLREKQSGLLDENGR